MYDTYFLSQERPGSDPADHVWNVRGPEGQQVAVWGGDIDDVAGAQAWATEQLADVGVTVGEWRQDDAGRFADWPYWTATPAATIHSTRDEAVAEVVEAIEAGEATRDEFDVDAIVDEVYEAGNVGPRGEYGYQRRNSVDHDTFWDIVECHER